MPANMWIKAFIAALVLSLPAHAERTVTDSAGRTLVVPDTIQRVFAAGPPASIFLYILAPDRLLGWPRAPRADERAYLAPEYRDLPELGRLTGRGDTANVEVILTTRPDIIFDFGSIVPTYVSLADRVQAQTGIPYLLIDGSFANTAESLRLMGRILGVEERAEQLAQYTENTLAQLDKTLVDIPPEQRPEVYLARGPQGLETGVRGSINTEIIERVGAINTVEAPAQRGLAQVSVEQLMLWNPAVIVALDDRFSRSVEQNPLWRSVDAVAAKRVYLAPRRPFGWVDRPPSVNRLIGVQWLAQRLYPAYFTADLAATVRDFYRLFYHLELSEQQLADLLAGS